MAQYIKVSELPTNINELRNRDFIIASNGVNAYTHIYHKYPAKFIPHLPRWAINFTGSKDLLIIDPFCGSGTTNLEAYLQGRQSIGFDIDPLALLISRVKTTPIDPLILERIRQSLFAEIESIGTAKGLFSPNVETLSHWFSEDAIQKLAIIRKSILEIQDEYARDFFLVTFSSIIREISNADNQSQKTYVSHTFVKDPPEVLTTFRKRVELYIYRMKQFYEVVKNFDPSLRPIFISKDTSSEFSEYVNNVDQYKSRLAITSPPYIKAIDYIYNQMLEYFWMGDLLGLENQQIQNEYKKKYIGTKQVSAYEYNSLPELLFDIPDLDSIIKIIYSENKKHGYITYKYFESMQKNLLAVRQVLRSGERYFIVVGNTNVSGYDISTNNFLAQIAESNGYKFLTEFSYKIVNRYMRFDRKGRGGFVEKDTVLLLEKK